MGIVRKLFGHKQQPEFDDSRTEEEASAGDEMQLGPAQSAARAHTEAEHMPSLRVGRASDTGLVRTHNEDALLVFESQHHADKVFDLFALFILADGMGGHQAGEVASALAARTVAHQVLQHVYLPYLSSGQADASQLPLTEALTRAVDEASQLVYKTVPGGGTTLTCALVVNDRAVLAHVGDSRAYLYQDGQLRQITKDHSYVDKLVELGQLTAEEAAAHPQKNVLYRAVGQEGTLEVDTYLETLRGGNRLLLCCDGLWSMVPEREIARILGSAATPQEACDQLVGAANTAGGRDNITAIVVEMNAK
jgi:protein phosphatase